MMNEPRRGYIDLQSFHSWDYNTGLHLSYYPTALQSFRLGAGHRTEVAYIHIAILTAINLKKLDVVEDPMANPQEGDERVKETVLEGPLKVLLEDPIANPPDNNEHVKEMAREGLSEVSVVKDPLAAVFSDPLVAAKLLVPASRPSATTSTAFPTIKSSMPSISTEVLACSVSQAPVPATDAIPLNSDNTIRGPVTPAGTNTTTDADTSSGGTKSLSPAPRSVKTVENETVTKDRKASCRDGNNAKSICKQLLDTKQSGGMESAFARHWEALCTSGGDKAFIDQANAK
ncbi:hypothetical protein LshimejAT787_0701070 [Lyophyllum shimeji]|uniref:Uncharacterized protein n=1 Tax=Lyophyllum shimeji TaxID=47721 RepID=A0A9P3UNR3_LYOSH|nr:hypothetical protein LshimejAT787_0701070 [Lyophyllum shimeji]